MFRGQECRGPLKRVRHLRSPGEEFAEVELEDVFALAADTRCRAGVTLMLLLTIPGRQQGDGLQEVSALDFPENPVRFEAVLHFTPVVVEPKILAVFLKVGGISR
jgi:hypothetical protein